MNTEITLENEQDKINCDEKLEKLICDVVNAAIEEQNFEHDCMVSVTLVDNERIHEINREFRGVDRSTDVLSFPVLEFDGGELEESCGDVFEGKYILGDVVLSLERAREQCIEYGHSFEREVGFLVCHSILHLLGHDHETDGEREVMRRHEEATLEKLGLTR